MDDVIVGLGCPACTAAYDLVRVYLPNGSQAGGAQWLDGEGMDAEELIVGDFDGDGNTDAAILNPTADNIAAPELLLLFANGTGVWDEPLWLPLGKPATRAWWPPTSIATPSPTSPWSSPRPQRSCC